MDERWLSELYEKYGYAVHRRCQRLLRSEAEADDALQEVFMRAMKYGHTFDGTSALGWLYRIADRHCYDVLSKRKRRAGDDEAREAIERLDEVPGDRDLERAHAVAKVLAACAGPIQDVAVLYYLDEMTQEEVAEAVGVSRKTVKQRLAKFLSTARTLLEAPSVAARGAS